MNNIKQPETVTFVKNEQGPHGSQKIWRREDGSHILTSSADFMLGGYIGISETMVFEADENGEITDLGELAVVNVPESHEEALAEAGYQIGKETK